MRTLFVLLTSLVLTQATISYADDGDQDQDLYDTDYSNTFEEADVVAKAGSWNRWTCIGKRPFVLRLYRGSSFYFRPQSGEGQGAKLVAQKIALRACEFANNATCTSNLNECTVESF